MLLYSRTFKSRWAKIRRQSLLKLSLVLASIASLNKSRRDCLFLSQHPRVDRSKTPILSNSAIVTILRSLSAQVSLTMKIVSQTAALWNYNNQTGLISQVAVQSRLSNKTGLLYTYGAKTLLVLCHSSGQLVFHTLNPATFLHQQSTKIENRPPFFKLMIKKSRFRLLTSPNWI